MSMNHEEAKGGAGKSRISGQTIGIVIIVVVLMLFVFANRDTVRIDFLLFDVNIALIWVLVGTALFGAAAGFLFGRRSRKD